MRTTFSVIVLVMLSTSVTADEPTHRIYAKPVARPAPDYPFAELRRGRQGWVELSYVVTSDGAVIDPVVEASSGSKPFERAAKEAVMRFEYEPARVNGEAVQQCKTKVRVAFALDGAQEAVSREFNGMYRLIDRSLDRGDVEKAKKRLASLDQSEGLTIAERSWLWAMHARIAGLEGNSETQLRAIQRAAPGSQWIPDQLSIGLLKTKASLELDKGDYSSALETYSKLKSIEGADTAQLDKVVAQIDALVASDKLFFKEARIGEDACESCEGQWRYRPLRRSIEIADLRGSLDRLEVRCDWQRFVDDAREGVAWSIPEAWGDCSVVVLGEPGSTFKLFEIPTG